jgi:predicted GNAT family acetyltransferase
MTEIKFDLDERKHGSFKLFNESGFVGEMVVSVSANQLRVYHTEIKPEEKGKGYAKLLLNAMLVYVRENKLMVIPLCPFVYAQFKRQPELYKDVWDGKES